MLSLESWAGECGGAGARVIGLRDFLARIGTAEGMGGSFEPPILGRFCPAVGRCRPVPQKS